ncbi:MAG: DUF4956 domain-containing protein, partial [Propionicimonas sp.]|nr:DUF4956 domain-containing protein [Propionicimonas sp.]
ITLDRAITDEAELRSELTSLLGARVDQVTVRQLDLVRDLTVVDVQYRTGRPAGQVTAARTESARELEGLVAR